MTPENEAGIIDIIIDILLWRFGGAVKSGAPRLSLTVRRIAAAVAAVAFGAYAFLVLVQQLSSRFDPIGAIFGSFTATVTILCGWFAVRGDRPESRRYSRVTMRGGLIVGGIGLAAGVFGPIIFAPEANQGPLLGMGTHRRSAHAARNELQSVNTPDF